MTQTNVDPKWQKIWEEGEAARTALFQICSDINRKVSMGINPTADDLSKLESVEKRWEDAWRKMTDFLKAYGRIGLKA